MKTPDSLPALALTPRPSETVAIRIPVDVLESLREEAASRETSLEALLRLYVGAGLRQDLVRRYSERLMVTTAKVLTHHLSSEAEVSQILREIRAQVVTGPADTTASAEA